MAKKKKHHKKSQYKAHKQKSHAQKSVALTSSVRVDNLPAVATTAAAAPVKPPKTPPHSKDSVAVASDQGDQKGLPKEVRHSLGLAAGIFIGLVVLWFIFAHTGLGAYVYGLVKV